MAAAEASFSTSIEATSFGLMSSKPPEAKSKGRVALDIKSFLSPVIGIPSTTYSGAFPALNDRRPRIKMFGTVPGLEPDCATSTPAIRPCMAWPRLVIGISVICLGVTCEIAPVNWLFL